MVTSELPEWARRVLDAEGASRVEEAIAEAERHTSGEIVPIVVRGSSTIGHVFLLAFALLLLIVYIADLPDLLFQFGGPHWLWQSVSWVGSGVLGIILSRWSAVQRLLTPKTDQIEQVDRRAELEFFELGIGGTRGGTGVLLLVSLMEHRAVVLADHSIAEKLDAGTWQELVDLMIASVKRDDLAGGMTQAVLRCGELLAPHFPIHDDDENELRNHLVVKD